MKGNDADRIEIDGHNFLLSELVYVGPVDDYFFPSGKAQYFHVVLRQGEKFYLEPEHRDTLLARWEEYFKHAQT